MRRITELRVRLSQLLGRGAAEERMDEEIRFHIEMETEKNIRSGMDPVEARRRARLAFGSIQGHRDTLRGGRRIPFEDVFREAWLAVRSLFRSRSFAIICILTIGVAIGASTAIFSVVDAVLLRPLPYPAADELVTVRLEVELEAREDISFSDRGFWHFRERNRTFERFGGFTTTQHPLVRDGDPVQVDGAPMTVDAFEAIGVAPVLGRLPTREEDVPNGPDLALISSGLWLERYGGDTNILGRNIQLGSRPFEVIGVMPQDYDFPTPETDVWYPYRLDPASENFGGHHIQVVGRLRDGVSLGSARSDAASLIQRFEEAGYGPEWVSETFTGSATIETIPEQVVGAARRPLFILLGTVGFVLLVACGNVANLLLVRSESRSRERAVRAALGASRWRLVKDVFVESLAIAVSGGALGLLLAYAGTRILVAAAPTAIPRLDEIRTSGSVLLFTSAIVMGAALLVAVFPALRVASSRFVETLRDGGRSATVGRDRHRARRFLIVVQVALTLVLLVGAGLMVRSFQELRAIDPGFRPEGVLTFGIYLPSDRYREPDPAAAFIDRLVRRIDALPGVTSAGGINTLPFTGDGAIYDVLIEDFPTRAGDPSLVFPVRRVTPGYFETIGIPLVEGRTFEPADHEQRLGTAIVSASLKETYWPDSSAVGEVMDVVDRSTIVGVVGDVHSSSLTSPPEQTIYLPMLDAGSGGVRGMTIAVRTSGEPMDLVPLIRQTIAEMDPLLPMTDVRTMSDIVGDSVSRVTFTMSLLSLAALVALFLGSVGIFGVISYIVAQRTAEIGIRQALGAAPRQVRGLVMRQAMALTAVGIVIGLVAAGWLGRSLSTLVYEVAPFDPASFLGGSLVFLLVAAAAALIPAMRAARVQPALALRRD